MSEGKSQIKVVFVRLKSKMHSIKNTDSKEFNMANAKMKRIQSKKQKFGPHEVNKKPLSCFDDKRYILDDGIHVLAYFHKDLKKQEDF